MVKSETLMTTPVWFIDLVKHYDAIMPSTIEKKKRESEKTIPVRKRTTLVPFYVTFSCL
jgi:hypothetical protein